MAIKGNYENFLETMYELVKGQNKGHLHLSKDKDSQTSIVLHFDGDVITHAISVGYHALTELRDQLVKAYEENDNLLGLIKAGKAEGDKDAIGKKLEEVVEKMIKSEDNFSKGLTETLYDCIKCDGNFVIYLNTQVKKELRVPLIPILDEAGIRLYGKDVLEVMKLFRGEETKEESKETQ